MGSEDTRESTRRFYEVDAESIVLASLYRLVKSGKIKPEKLKKAVQEFGIDPKKPNPVVS